MYNSTMVNQDDGLAPPKESTEAGHKITRNKDGSISVAGPTVIKARIPKTGEFDENLAGVLTLSGKGLAGRLCDFYTTDIESRVDWETREHRSMEMMGIQDTIPPENDKAPGMNKVTHPMLMEAATRFQANAIVEIFPATGPAKPKILGSVTAAKEAKAERIEMFINYYLTEVDRGYFADTDQMLYYLPMSGSAFRKAGQNWVTGLPEMRYIKATNFVAPYAGTDLASMPRYCHEYTMTGDDIRRAQDSGMFDDTVTLSKSNDAEHAPSSDLADGRVNNLHEDDSLYTILEYHIDLEMDQDPEITAAHQSAVRPYICIVVKEDEKVLLLRRNWKKKDESCKKRIWFAHHKYLPGLGFYGFGLCHVIGSLGNAASGAVNALLDGAQMANFQGGFKAKEGKSLAGEVRLEAGVWKDMDASYEDLSKSFYTPPFKEPSPALFHLLDSLVNSGQRFAGTADVAVGDANNNAPVGTTIALIEQSQKPQSAIHKRLHKSMSDELKMFTELVHEFIPKDGYIYSIGGDTKNLFKDDFDGSVDVVSVTDPNIYSDTQRIQQAQALDQLMQQHPDLFTPKKRAEAVLRMMQALKIPDIKDVAPEADTPKYLDAVAENGLIVQGKGVRAYTTQDHAAHIKIHQHGAATTAAAQMDPNTQQAILAGYGVHIRDHMAEMYSLQIYAAANIPPPPLDEDGNPVELDAKTEAMVTAAVVAKLPPNPAPPAPPPAAPSPQDKAQQQLAANQQLHEQKLAQNQETFAQAQQLKKQEMVEEQTRQEAAHKQALRRTTELTAAEQKRKDAETAASLIRKGAEAKVNIRTKLKEHAANHRQNAVGTHLTLRAQAAAARQKLEQDRADREEARKAAIADRQEAAKAKTQERQGQVKHSAEMNRQKAVAGKVGLQQKRQAVKIAARKKPSKPK
jgi:hypothetical protein